MEVEDMFIFKRIKNMKYKIILFIFLICFLSSCTLSTKTISNASSLDSIVSKKYEVVPEGIPPDEFTDYESIIEEYRRFAGYCIERRDEYLHGISQGDTWYSRGWLGNLLAGITIPDRNSFYYAIKDLNENGSSELILMYNQYTLGVEAIFSMVDGKPLMLDLYIGRHSCYYISDTGLIYTKSTGGANIWQYRIQEISEDDSELVLLEEFGANGSWDENNVCYKLVDGEQVIISRDELDKLIEKHFDFLDEYNQVPKENFKDTGLEFIPLFD